MSPFFDCTGPHAILETALTISCAQSIFMEHFPGFRQSKQKMKKARNFCEQEKREESRRIKYLTYTANRSLLIS